MRNRRLGVASLRVLNATRLHELSQRREVIEICYFAAPLAVLVPYDLYMEWQKILTPRWNVPELREDDHA